ncbi:hypothetical protein CCDG5_1029 [[Clostridium] cellulosi]|uniref:Phosphatidylglycerol lysyltransferase C-terminal domain-containing protein n=1 Tax=[Clostridium] cellulosi TaxID=29343 RepID=A0A078KKD7_9FIRM|nr:hypothetical protein CCDG5_1029 [[Clostridium] cellulosi]
MLKFRELQIEDKQLADKILYPLNYRLCEFCFGDLFLWRKIYNTEIAFENDFMFIRYLSDDKRYYLFPAGSGDIKSALRKIYRQALEEGDEFRLACITPEMKEEIEEYFPGVFEYTPVRSSFDYIYNASDLITLAGRKFHSKRNHISRFEKLGNWKYEDITKDNISLCEEMSDEWCKINGCKNNVGLFNESCAVKQAFKHFFDLGLSGGVLYLEGRVVAFSMGQKLCNDTYIVHIEKAFSDVEGAYTMINREFAAHNCQDFVYINREDDAGDDGLRKAKLSYHPAILLEKNYAVLKDGATL